MNFRRLVYKNFFGDFNILVTVSSDGKRPQRETLIPDNEIYETHIWIHDNVVKKNHTGKDVLLLDSVITNDELYLLLGNVDLQILKS